MTGDSARRTLSDLRNELMKQRDAAPEEAKLPIRAEIKRLGDEIDVLDFENTRAVAASLDVATHSVEALVATAKLDPSSEALQKVLGRLDDAASEAADTLGAWFGPRAFAATEKNTAQPLLDFAVPALAAGAAGAAAKASGASTTTAAAASAAAAAAATVAVGVLPALVTGSKLSELADDYSACWSACLVDEARAAAVNRSVDHLLQGVERYKAVSKQCNDVPWQLIGIMHGLECGYDFAKHLHNGDPLSAPTRRVPAGRPPGWNGTGSWEESAQDAVKLKRLDSVSEWSLPRVLYALEGFNGFGYRSQGVRSPYLWSCSNLYTKGKYIADHVFDPSAVSKQVGAAVVLKVLEERKLWP
jgi:lysozyme family protein